MYAYGSLGIAQIMILDILSKSVSLSLSLSNPLLLRIRDSLTDGRKNTLLLPLPSHQLVHPSTPHRHPLRRDTCNEQRLPSPHGIAAGTSVSLSISEKQIPFLADTLYKLSTHLLILQLSTKVTRNSMIFRTLLQFKCFATYGIRNGNYIEP